MKQPAERREADKDEWVLHAADFLLSHMRADGRVEIVDTQYPEGLLYLAGDVFPLLESFVVSRDERYLVGARAALDCLRATQQVSGGWLHGFLEGGGERTETIGGYGTFSELALVPSVATTGWAMAAVRKYERIAQDCSYRPVVENAITYLESVWDDRRGFDDGPVRATFRDTLVIVGLSLWSDEYPLADSLLSRAVSFVTESPRCWSQHDVNWMSDVGGRQPAGVAGTTPMCCALLEATSTRFVKSHIQPALERILSDEEYHCSHNPALVNYRPFREDRADIRSNVYLLLLMKLLDRVTGTTGYSRSHRYARIAAWLETMRDEEGFFEYENCHDGSKGGHASPAQFLVSFWVCGTYGWH